MLLELNDLKVMATLRKGPFIVRRKYNVSILQGMVGVVTHIIGPSLDIRDPVVLLIQ